MVVTLAIQVPLSTAPEDYVPSHNRPQAAQWLLRFMVVVRPISPRAAMSGTRAESRPSGWTARIPTGHARIVLIDPTTRCSLRAARVVKGLARAYALRTRCRNAEEPSLVVLEHLITRGASVALCEVNLLWKIDESHNGSVHGRTLQIHS